MSRFLSLHWSPVSADAQSTVAHVKQRMGQRLGSWGLIFDAPGVLVYGPATSLEPREIRILENRGVLFGTLFPRMPGTSSEQVANVTTLDRRMITRMVQTQGRSLICDFWGSYVAILTNARDDCSHVLRGPLSPMKCFYTAFGPLQIFFSHVEYYAQLSLSPLAINWDCIRAQAACSDYLARETAIRDVFALSTGECAEVSRNGARSQFYWNPCNVAKQKAIDDFGIAASELRSVTQSCVQSWAAHYGRIVHTLSGGLDSSIAVCCARRVLPKTSMVCVNYYSDDATGDERRFAREVAAKADVELLELEREQAVDLEIFHKCARTAWPMLDFSGYGRYRSELELVRQWSATAIFCGELGDNLFEHGAGLEAAVDYVWRLGIRPGLIRVAVEVALRRNVSVWRVLSRAIRDGSARSSASRWDSFELLERELGIRVTDMTLVRSDVLHGVQASAERFIHPWLEAVEGTPPAKRTMIVGMYLSDAHEHPFANISDAPKIAPLASQPLAEVCLRTPTYFCNRRGTNRAVARHAFADLLPDSVINRETKGTPESWTRAVVRRNHDFLKSFLLEGVLVREGILDPKRVEATLADDVSASKVFIADLIVQVYIEAWVRQWQAACSSLAA